MCQSDAVLFVSFMVASNVVRPSKQTYTLIVLFLRAHEAEICPHIGDFMVTKRTRAMQHTGTKCLLAYN